MFFTKSDNTSSVYFGSSFPKAIWNFTELFLGFENNEDDSQDSFEQNSIVANDDSKAINKNIQIKEKQDNSQYRIKRYEEEFLILLEAAQRLDASCTEEEMEKAKNIFFVHNLIEEVCYRALPDALKKFGITTDTITPAQSMNILAYVKEVTHVELRKEGGYTKKGREMITPAQFNGVLANIAIIIHDRDARLTDARYSSLTDLCAALDDHNSYIKNILFKSWFRCPQLSCDTHLAMIKDIVDFNQRISEQLGFNFEQSLSEKKAYYDIHHQKIRAIECPTTGEKTAKRFVNLTEVRATFDDEVIEKLLYIDRQSPLLEYLEKNCSYSPEELSSLTNTRRVSSPARFGFWSQEQINQPALLCNDLCVGDFLKQYYPEKISREKIASPNTAFTPYVKHSF